MSKIDSVDSNMSESKVYVLLPVHNRREITLNFIECLKLQTHKNYHLIIVDDGSSDGTAEAARQSLKQDISIITGTGNWWWAGSLQQGYDWLLRNEMDEESYLLTMNDDTEFSDNFIESGLRIIEQYPETILTATGYNVKNSQPQDSGGYKFDWRDLSCTETFDSSEINCLSTRGMLIRVGDFVSTDGFYPLLLPHYLSDLEFTMRAEENGMNLMVNKDFKIYIDFDETGFRDLEDHSLFPYLRKMFSRRSAGNPLYWSSFILLRAPWKFKLFKLFHVWASTFQEIFIVRIYFVHKPWINRMIKWMKNMIKKIIQMPF